MKVPFNDLNRIHNPMRNEIDEAIKRVIDKNAYVLGKEVETFEENFADYNQLAGKDYAAGVSNGMEALELILRAIGVGHESEVITVANTFNATASAIVNAGAKPVLVDINPEDYLIETNNLESVVSSKTKAIMPVHLYGQQTNMAAIQEFAIRNGLCIIEDACQAHGSEQHHNSPGYYGSAAAFSFYPGKNLGAFGDGGMIISGNKELIAKIKKIRNYGQSKKYHHDELGKNSRLDGLQAAILDLKLKKLDEWNYSRAMSAQKYNKLLEGLEEVVTPKVAQGNNHVYHLYVIQAENRDGLMKYLDERGIESGIHYPIPIHKQKAFENLGYKTGDFPVSERVSDRIVSLPIFPYMADKEIEYVTDNVKSFYRK